MDLKRPTFGLLWRDLLQQLYNRGDQVNPRGITCYELCGVSLKIEDARANVLVNDARKLAYRFAVAEWLWIYFGHDDVATIARYNPNIAQFSDDGERFHGAYGTRVYGGLTRGIDQWYQVIELLRRDPDTRQAVIAIFGPNDAGATTKDVPCTISLQLLARRGKLNAILTMRSSDVWLGLPYDVFTFTMLQNIAAAQVGLEVGWFKANLGSSHLYARNVEQAKEALTASSDTLMSPALPAIPPAWLDDVLRGGQIPHAAHGSFIEPWASYADALISSNAGTFSLLRGLSEGHQDRPGAVQTGQDGTIPVDPSSDHS